MSNFIPKRTNDVLSLVKNALLEGKVVRYDGENRVEIMDRDCIPYLHSLGNIGRLYRCGLDAEEYTIPRSITIQAIKELRNEYVVQCIRCEASGCCQYTTYGAFIQSI